MASRKARNALISLLLLLICVPTYAENPWTCAGVSDVGQPQRWIDWLGRVPYCTMSGWLANSWGDWNAYEQPDADAVKMCAQAPGKEIYKSGYVWAYLEAYPEDKARSGHAWYTSGPNAWSWLDCADGKYNRHYRALAENCVKSGCGNTVLNLFNEANGDWFAWAMYKSVSRNV